MKDWFEYSECPQLICEYLLDIDYYNYYDIIIIIGY